jgi:hypothetical protein
MPPRTPVNVFFCYAPQDEDLRKELEKHLALLMRQGFVRTWSSRVIGAGEEWRGAIDRHLEEADAILLLVSPDFLASDYLYDVELRRALERHRTERTKVISIILRPCDYANCDAQLRAAVDLVLPAGCLPVTSWRTHDEAFASVAQGLRDDLERAVRSASGRPLANPRQAHPSRASGGWARAKRRAKDHTRPCPRRGTCRTGATPRSRAATSS